MIDRERLEEIVLEELQKAQDEEARKYGEERAAQEEESDALLRHARERRGY